MNDQDLKDTADASGKSSPSRAWTRRLGYALRGVSVAVLNETNFLVYLACAAAAAGLGAWVGLSTERWGLIVLCTAFVLVAEMFNTAIEHLARAVTRESHPEIRDALDVASGAVFLAGLGAALVGAVVFGEPLTSLLR